MNEYANPYGTPYPPYVGQQNAYMGGYRPGYTSPYSYGQNVVSGQAQQNQMVQQQSSQYQQPQSNIPWIQVPNYDAAKNLMIGPNQTAYMMAQNAPEFYVKSTDNMGIATMKAYHFEEFDPEQKENKTQTEVSSDYVTRSEMNNVLNGMYEELNALKQATKSQMIVQPQEPQSVDTQKKTGTNSGSKGTQK